MDSAEVLTPSDLTTAQPVKIVYLDQNRVRPGKGT